MRSDEELVAAAIAEMERKQTLGELNALWNHKYTQQLRAALSPRGGDRENWTLLEQLHAAYKSQQQRLS